MRRVGISLLLLCAWLGLAAGAMLPGTIPTALIIAPNETLLASLPADIAILDVRPGWIILRSDDPDYVRQLYRAGAHIVLPARQKTCLDLQS